MGCGACLKLKTQQLSHAFEKNALNMEPLNQKAPYGDRSGILMRMPAVETSLNRLMLAHCSQFILRNDFHAIGMPQRGISN